MGFNVTFDASRVSERPAFDPITPGEYTVNVEETAEKISRKSGRCMSVRPPRRTSALLSRRRWQFTGSLRWMIRKAAGFTVCFSSARQRRF